jgi:hypothetical protein
MRRHEMLPCLNRLWALHSARRKSAGEGGAPPLRAKRHDLFVRISASGRLLPCSLHRRRVGRASPSPDPLVMQGGNR